ncbi:MAG: ATP synthase F1 subunit gamma [Planctomycetaceae bacterium]|nr:ATP synthase F1 subunit gamma [Planctomycetaceae bacterium]
MAKARALDKRRKSIKNIRKITRTMELVATAQFKRAMDRAVAIDSYAKRLVALVQDLRSSGANLAGAHPLLEERKEQKNVTLLVLTANRGMCGGYNSGILRLANNRLKEIQGEYERVNLEVSGKRGIGAFKFRKVKLDAEFVHFEDKPTFEQVDEIASRYYEEYVAGTIDRLEIVYQNFASLSRQTPKIETLLPISEKTFTGEEQKIKEEEAKTESLRPKSAAELKKAALVAKAEKMVASQKERGLKDSAFNKGVGFEFLPSAQDIIAEVVPYSFRIKLYKCFLDAAVGEQIARMVAMKAATENADGIIGNLTTAYNRARQSQITNEISEIIGGAAALEG